MSRWARAQVDDAVAAWNRDFEVATKNIIELKEDPSYKWLAGDGDRPPAPIKGLTAQEVRPALQALDAVWQMLPALNDLLDEVNRRHHSLPFFGGSDELYEIQKLIEDESIDIVTSTTYEQRGLLTPDEIRKGATPRQVLQSMVEGYGRAKAAVVKVAEAVGQLFSRLNEAAEDIAVLRSLAGELGEAVPELDKVQSKLADLKAEIASDPLSVQNDFDKEVLSVIDPLRRRLDEVQAERNEVAKNIAAADAIVTALEAAFASATTSYRERVLKVTVDDSGRVPTPFDSSVIVDLRAWLERLRTTLAQGKWRPAGVGFMNWKAQVEARVAHCHDVARENSRYLDRRRELRGLLESLKAKAVNTGLAEDEGLARLYRQAYELLYSRPTPLLTAEKLVSEYLAAVR